MSKGKKTLGKERHVQVKNVYLRCSVGEITER